MKACNSGQIIPRVACVIAALLLVASGARAQGDPLFYEAEDIASKYGKVQQDETASGRMYITANPEKFIPLVSVKLPADFQKLTIWARIRGCSEILKTDLNGEAVDLKMKGKVSDFWEWVDFGTYSRSELGESIRFVRTPGKDGGIDAVFLDPTGQVTPSDTSDLKKYESRP